MASNLDYEGFQEIRKKMKGRSKPKINPNDAKAVGDEWKRMMKTMSGLK